MQKRLLNIVFHLALPIHVALVFYLSRSDAAKYFYGVADVFSSSYSNLGFEWVGGGANVITVALVSSFFINSSRRIVEGVFLGWPQFKGHDKNSLIRAFCLLALYGLIAYLAVGFFGEKYSSRNLDFLNFFIICLTTYIFGLIIDLLDDFISAVYIVLSGGEL